MLPFSRNHLYHPKIFIMTGVILAAGKGSRLGNLTEDTPKSLLPLSPNQTLLDYNLDMLDAIGCERVLIVTGFSGWMIEEHTKARPHIQLVYNPFWNQCNVLGSLYMALPQIQDDFYFLHADTLAGKPVWDKLTTSPGEMVLPYHAKPCGAEEMKVKVQENTITEINKTMPPDSAAGEFLGIARFSESSIPMLMGYAKSIFQRGELQAYMEAAVQESIDAGHRVDTFEIGDAPFVEVDFKEDYELAQKLFG